MLILFSILLHVSKYFMIVVCLFLHPASGGGVKKSEFSIPPPSLVHSDDLMFWLDCSETKSYLLPKYNIKILYVEMILQFFMNFKIRNFF